MWCLFFIDKTSINTIRTLNILSYAFKTKLYNLIAIFVGNEDNKNNLAA